MNDSHRRGEGGDEVEWGTARDTVDAIALGGLAQAVEFAVEADLDDVDGPRQLIRSVKRALRAAAGRNSADFAFVVKPQAEGLTPVHVVSRHLVRRESLWTEVARLSGFVITSIHPVSGSAREEALRMLELPVRKAIPSEAQSSHVREHLWLNDDRWVNTVGHFWWDGDRKLSGIMQAREVASLRDH